MDKKTKSASPSLETAGTNNAPLGFSHSAPLSFANNRPKKKKELSLNFDLLCADIPNSGLCTLILGLPLLWERENRPLAARFLAHWLWKDGWNEVYETQWKGKKLPELKLVKDFEEISYSFKSKDRKLAYEFDVDDLNRKSFYRELAKQYASTKILAVRRCFEKIAASGKISKESLAGLETGKEKRLPHLVEDWQDWLQWLQNTGTKSVPWGSFERRNPAWRKNKVNNFKPSLSVGSLTYPFVGSLPEPLRTISRYATLVTDVLLDNSVSDESMPDELMLALGSFSFGYYVTGTARRLDASAVEVTVETIGYRISDSYDFGDDTDTSPLTQPLGTWSRDYFAGYGPPITSEEFALSNARFNDFRNMKAHLNKKIKDDFYPQVEIKAVDFFPITKVLPFPQFVIEDAKLMPPWIYKFPLKKHE